MFIFRFLRDIFLCVLVLLSDIYFNMLDYFDKIMAFLAWNSLKYTRKLITNNTHNYIVYAEVSDDNSSKDITLILWHYYLTDEYKTDASLYRKLKRNNINERIITLMFVYDGNVYKIKFDIITSEKVDSNSYEKKEPLTVNNLNLDSLSMLAIKV